VHEQTQRISEAHGRKIGTMTIICTITELATAWISAILADKSELKAYPDTGYYYRFNTRTVIKKVGIFSCPIFDSAISQGIGRTVAYDSPVKEWSDSLEGAKQGRQLR
jgi:hypothetical protein